jgi:hypothetical protein
VNRYRFIAEEKAHHSVALLCRVLHVAKSAFYAWHTHESSARSRADDRLIDERSRQSTTTADARTVRRASTLSCAGAAHVLAASVSLA